LSTKDYAVVEMHGQLAKRCQTGGQVHDEKQYDTLLDGITARAVLTDKAYNVDDLKAIKENGAKTVIPLKSNRKQQGKFDAEKYKNRYLVELFFCLIKQFRRIAIRYQKPASRYWAYITLIASLI
jgi:transposase